MSDLSIALQKIQSEWNEVFDAVRFWWRPGFSGSGQVLVVARRSME